MTFSYRLVGAGDLILAGEVYRIEHQHMPFGAETRLRRRRDGHLFQLKPAWTNPWADNSGGPEQADPWDDIGHRHVIDVRTGERLTNEDEPILVSQLGDVLEPVVPWAATRHNRRQDRP